MNFFIYLGQASVYAFIMWAIYCAILRNRPAHRHSRAFLLLSLFLPAILPLIRIAVAERSSVAIYKAALPEIGLSSQRIAPQPVGISWIDAAIGCYILFAVIIAATYAITYIRLRRRLARGTHHLLNGYSIITDAGIGPGTIGKRVFFPDQHIDPVIMKHELGHIRLGHRYDSLLLQVIRIVFWISPAHWLIGKELKMIHEFEVDAAASREVDIHDYAALLLSQAFGANHAVLIAHSFFHQPLKRRIMMLQLQKQPLKKYAIVLGLGLLLFFSATVLIAQSRKGRKDGSKGASATSKADSFQAKARKIISGQDTTHLMYGDGDELNPKAKIDSIGYMLYHGGVLARKVEGTEWTLDKVQYRFVPQMPQFAGNLAAWMAANLKYPDSARARGLEGKTGIEFVVTETGKITDVKVLRSSGHTLLDEEAVRVVNMMPKWKPGRLDGKPVSVIFTMPVSFKLD